MLWWSIPRTFGLHLVFRVNKWYVYLIFYACTGASFESCIMTLCCRCCGHTCGGGAFVGKQPVGSPFATSSPLYSHVLQHQAFPPLCKFLTRSFSQMRLPNDIICTAFITSIPYLLCMADGEWTHAPCIPSHHEELDQIQQWAKRFCCLKVHPTILPSSICQG